MENASKALIIAGAILLAIVIISLGLIVVNNSRSVTENANLSEQEIQSFNAKFAAYEGTNVSGSRVNSLIQQVIATNSSLIDEGKTQFVTIGFPSMSSSVEKAILFMGVDANNKWKYYYVNDKSTREEAATGVSFTGANGGPKDDTFNTSGVTDPTFNNVKFVLSVKTGQNYNVKLYYKNGLVKAIAVY